MRPAKSTSSSLISHHPSHPSHLALLLPSRLRRHASGRQGRAGRRVTHCRRARAGRSGRERARADPLNLHAAYDLRVTLFFAGRVRRHRPRPDGRPGTLADAHAEAACAARAGRSAAGAECSLQSPPPPPPQHGGRAGGAGRAGCRVTEGRTGRGGGYSLQIADGAGLRAGTQLCNDNGTAH